MGRWLLVWESDDSQQLCVEYTPTPVYWYDTNF